MPAIFGESTPFASMRVHGTAAQVEFPETDLEGHPSDSARNSVVYRGQGAIVQGYVDLVWVHFSIPAPKPLEPTKHLVVSKAFAFFETTPYVVVKHVHLWDGKYRFLQRDDLNSSGDFTKNLVPGNSWVTDRVIVHSFGISIGVEFPLADDRPQITFTGAGADYHSFTPLATHFVGDIPIR